MEPDVLVEELHQQSNTQGAATTAAFINDLFVNQSFTAANKSVASVTDQVDVYFFYPAYQFTIMGVLFVAIVFLNSSVIAALLCTNARKSRMNFFIMQLAIADLAVGILYVFMDIITKITISWYAGEFMCKLLKFLQAVVMYASTYILVALSIDRCDAITNPMNFSGSWNRARGLVISAWLISGVFSIPLLFLFELTEVQGEPQCWIELGSPERWQIWMTLVALAILILPALAIAACYTIIVLTIWTKSKTVVMSPTVTSGHTKSIRNCQLDDPDSRRASSRGLIPRAKIKSVKMTFVIVFVFVVCWAPYIVFDLLQVYGYIPATQTAAALATLVQSLAPLNSAANPLICCMFSPHIYTSLRRVPPYRWLWRLRRRRGGVVRGRRGTLRSRSDSTANSDLLSSTHQKRNLSVALTLNRTGSTNYSHHKNGRKQEFVVMTVRD